MRKLNITLLKMRFIRNAKAMMLLLETATLSIQLELTWINITKVKWPIKVVKNMIVNTFGDN